MFFKFYNLEGELCVMKFDALKAAAWNEKESIFAIFGLFDGDASFSSKPVEPMAWFRSGEDADRTMNEIVTKIAINAPVCDLTEYRWQSETDETLPPEDAYLFGLDAASRMDLKKAVKS